MPADSMAVNSLCRWIQVSVNMAAINVSTALVMSKNVNTR